MAPGCRSMRAARRSSSGKAPSSAASTWAPRSSCCCLRAGASGCARSPPAAACGWARRSPGSREAEVSGGGDWRPSASRALLERRAALLACTREFFAARGVLEVDTPVVVNAPVSDVHLVSATVQLGRAPAYLHTSPEYAMKRLLAAGSGDIYQVCHVGRSALTFVHGYPASQAALARLDPEDPRTARRFELYCDGVELANGFHELASAAEQRERFERDNAQRRRLGLPVCPIDERLLAALESGLPDSAGVALGFERTLMLAAGASHIEEVLAFPTARA